MRILSAVVFFLLVGCVQPPPEDVFITATPDKKPEATKAFSVTPNRKPAPPDEPALPDIGALAKLPPAKLVKRLGPPDFIRTDPPARIWIYEGETCNFYAFLYEGKDGLKVDYLESRSKTILKVPPASCAADIIHKREKAGLKQEERARPPRPETPAAPAPPGSGPGQG